MQSLNTASAGTTGLRDQITAQLVALGIFRDASPHNQILITSESTLERPDVMFIAWVFVAQATASTVNPAQRISMSPDRSHDLFGESSPIAEPAKAPETSSSKPIMRSMPCTSIERALEQLLKGLAELLDKKIVKKVEEFETGMNEMVGDGLVLGVDTLAAIERAGVPKVGGEEKGLDDSDLELP